MKRKECQEKQKSREGPSEKKCQEKEMRTERYVKSRRCQEGKRDVKRKKEMSRGKKTCQEGKGDAKREKDMSRGKRNVKEGKEMSRDKDKWTKNIRQKELSRKRHVERKIVQGKSRERADIRRKC